MSEHHHKLVIEIVSEDRGQRQAQIRVLRWLETFGHTAVSHGFEFKTVGVMTGRFITTKKDKKK